MIKDEIEMLKDEENVPMRAGFIAGGGVLGNVKKKYFYDVILVFSLLPVMSHSLTLCPMPDVTCEYVLIVPEAILFLEI